VYGQPKLINFKYFDLNECYIDKYGTKMHPRVTKI